MKETVPGIDYRFRDPGLLRKALTHRSVGSVNNERLEFLGDSILSMVIASRLFELHPDAREGDLSRMRARLVRGTTLAELAESVGLGASLILGEGERKSGGFRRSSILADTFEALLGAIFLDGGYDASRRVILQLFDPLIEALPDSELLKDSKTRLQEWLQARGRPLPLYRLENTSGADHAREFLVSCRLQDSGDRVEESGSSRRRAEQVAAAAMLARLQQGDAS